MTLTDVVKQYGDVYARGIDQQGTATNPFFPARRLSYETQDMALNPVDPMPFQTREKDDYATDYVTVNCRNLGTTGITPGGVSFVPVVRDEPRKIKWHKRFQLFKRKGSK